MTDYKNLPQLRFMGNKYRLLPWIREEMELLEFKTALDGFSGSGSVSYLFKSMGKRVYSNDFLHFPSTIARGVIKNSSETITLHDLETLTRPAPGMDHFIEQTFSGIFFTPGDLNFLDRVSHHLGNMENQDKKALAMTALIRSCAKKQPRGVFTISGDLSRYDDGRRDLKLSLEEHFREQTLCYNRSIFSNGLDHKVFHGSIFDFPLDQYKADLVYLDPPYVPRSDDNCYIKRYHFLEGLSTYWKDEEILYDTKVRKIAKKYTPFSYRKSAVEAFDTLFRQFQRSTLVLSYSSNGFPDLDVLTELMGRYKQTVRVEERDHRYHFGTHDNVKRALVREYLIIGS
ncbi:DNA adenine methylase [Oceanispirochaeta sp.]|jgi:adenine-specific DNA-methyltransferase|uniref:DNA adenine methylase n=1 Tax=Oceanispirochaeta sp. TaxID=2035350 RepID=UPI002618D74B|nr:DNA adenine methylase [Oceanispirochaeta sp.]MDA3955474.1 DNA adenine methylase [Oceanispirochaeta sp.]